jgi:signal transduction histidine kinase
MSGFDPKLFQFILLLTLAVLYLPVAVYAFQRREGQEVSSYLAIGYSVLAFSINLLDTFWRDGELGRLSETVFQALQIFGALALAFLVMLIVLAFLRNAYWPYWFGLGALWGLGLALILTNALNLPEVVWSNGSLVLPREQLGPLWGIVGWLVFTLGAISTIMNAARQARQPLFRNRLNYWTPAFFFMLINDIMLFAGLALPGHPLRLAQTIIMTYAVCTHNLPDMRQIIRRALVYFIATALIVGFYVGGYSLAQNAFRSIPNFNPLLIGTVLALALSLIFAPLLGAIRRLVNRWIRTDQYDAGQTLHEYSQNISNILDMDRLANVAVGIILETMQIERGYLFLVDTDRDANGKKKYRLRSARSPEERQIVAVELDEDGPIASYLTNEQRPLLQYDLDLLPSFRATPPLEREWFDRLQTEVYLPIFAKRKWIGLLAFGSKLTGNRYTKDDLVTLSALANQTAVALENARLVENLMRLNTELRQARRQLEKNNRDLERLDQTKSDFISIASHELRTPLTVIKGYTEMVLEDDNLDPNYKQVMKGIHEGTLRLHEVMDSMFDIAQIDARALIPHLQSVDLGDLLKEICNANAKTLKERRQSLSLELPLLPLVKADPNLLKKLFGHLINNAIKFTPNDGRIAINGRAIPRNEDYPNGFVEIVVSDTGVGVDPTFRDIIFTKFYQPGELGKHSTSKTRFKGGGAGLGLALAKGIVEAHGGRIWVESPGYDDIHFPGSQFHVILPLSKPAAGESSKMSVPVKLYINGNLDK